MSLMSYVPQDAIVCVASWTNHSYGILFLLEGMTDRQTNALADIYIQLNTVSLSFKISIW